MQEASFDLEGYSTRKDRGQAELAVQGGEARAIRKARSGKWCQDSWTTALEGLCQPRFKRIPCKNRETLNDCHHGYNPPEVDLLHLYEGILNSATLNKTNVHYISAFALSYT